MTDEEKLRTAELLKAAWREGFQAARHHPSHPLPDLAVRWEGESPKLDVKWRHQMRGYIG